MRPIDLALRDLVDDLDQTIHTWLCFYRPLALPQAYTEAYTLVLEMQQLATRLSDTLGKAMDERAVLTSDENYLKAAKAYAKDKELKQWLREAADKEMKKHQAPPLVA